MKKNVPSAQTIVASFGPTLRPRYLALTRCWCIGNGTYISASSIADGQGKLADKKVREEYGGDIELVP